MFQTAVITFPCCGHKHVGGTKSREQRTTWWNQEVKEAIRAKKVAYKAWRANKRQPQKLNCLRKGPGWNLEKG